MSEITQSFPAIIDSLMEHWLCLGSEEERIAALSIIKQNVNARLKYEKSNPLNELKNEIKSFKNEGHFPEDIKTLNDIFKHLKKKQWTKAVELFEDVDTFVREHMPKKTYVWMYENYERVRT